MPVAIPGMHPLPTYLDAHDLAAIFEVSPATILRRARTKPQSLPPPVYLGPGFPLRWRQADVVIWLQEACAGTTVRHLGR